MRRVWSPADQVLFQARPAHLSVEGSPGQDDNPAHAHVCDVQEGVVLAQGQAHRVLEPDLVALVRKDVAGRGAPPVGSPHLSVLKVEGSDRSVALVRHKELRPVESYERQRVEPRGGPRGH